METTDEDTARFPPLDPDAPGDPQTDVSFPRRSGVAQIEPPPVIHSTEFRRWFGDWKNPDADHSVIVDERGRPDILFHGTILQPDAEIEGFEPGSFGISRSLGVHLAFDNRVTDAFTVGREAKDRSKRGPSSFRDTTAGEDAMSRIKEGGRVLPVFANVRNPLDLAEGFEPLGITAEDVWGTALHDDHLIQHTVTYLALEAQPELIYTLVENRPISAEEVRREAEEQMRKIRAGEAYEDEVPPGGIHALIAQNRSASASMNDEKRERFLEVFYSEYPYDGLIYVNTSGQEVTREEIDPLSLIVFDPANVKSIYAESFEPGDPTLGVRGNPPFAHDITAEDLRGPVSLEANGPARPNRKTTPPHEMPDSTDTGETRENERLEDRLRRQNPEARSATRGDGQRGAEPGRPNPSETSAGPEKSAERENEEEVRENDREDFVELMQAAARLRELFLEKRERIIEKGDEETARQFAQGFGPLFDLLREAADENDADFETVKDEVGLIEQIPEAVPERGPFGFPEGSFDDNFYLTAEGETEGHIAIHTSESAGDLVDGDIEDTAITASISKQITDALRDGDLPFTIEEWTKDGQKWEVAIGDPYGLDLQIKFGDRNLPTADKAYTVLQKGATSPEAFALFMMDLAKAIAPNLQEVRASDVQWRVADFADELIRRGQREGDAPEEYVQPRAPQSYVLGRPSEPGADPTIVMRSSTVFTTDVGPLPDEEVDLAIRRARQTGIKTAIFVGHGVSAVGQPQQLSRIVVGEKDLKTKPDYRHDPTTFSMVHSRSPQTISMVADENRRETTERGSAQKIRDLLGEVSDMETYRVFPVQQTKGETVDTFYRWHEPTKPENAVDAESEEDLGFSTGETVQASRADIERTFRPEDMGGEEFENVESDVDLTGREPLVLTPEERREANRQAIEIITNKQPTQVTDEDREVLLEYTGAGGLGTETGTGSVRGERTEHYTDYRLIRAMWSAMENVGQEGNILEPGAGIGNFAGLRPNDQTGHMVMVEQSSTTFDILEVLYPEQQTLHRNLASVDLRPFQLQGAIGNVPFADTQIHTKNDPVVQGLRTDPKIHDYFLLRALHEVEPGGVVMLITSTTTADRQDAELRRAMVRGVDDPNAPMSDHRAAFLGGFRLPSGAFEASASTAVTTDLLAFQKLAPGTPMDDLPAEIFERTNQFAENPATRTDVLRADRSQASEEATQLADDIESQEDRVGELRKRKQDLEERISETKERRAEFSWQDDEYDELSQQMRDLKEDLRDVQRRGRDAQRELESLTGQLEDMDGQRVTASLNRFFDENPEFILGELKFGFKRPALDLFGVDGDLQEAVDRIAEFDPELPVEPAREKALFAEGTGQRLGIERQHPDGAVVFREGTFYESQPVGYDPITVEDEFEDKARSAVDILETYEAFTRALAREDEETETVRESLKVKLRNHVRRFGVPGDDPALMEEVFRFDPRRPTLAALVETNAVGNVQFADVLDFNDWYRNDQKSSIEDDENLEAISQFLRAQGEKLSAESYARFYKGGELDVGQMEDLLEESDSFYFIPQVASVEVIDLSEDTIDKVLDNVDIEEVDEDLTAVDVVAERAADAWKEREGSYMPEVFFTSGEIWSRIDLYEEIRERSSDSEVQDRMAEVLDTLREALPQQKEYWDIAIDPRHFQSWLPIEILQEWIEDETGYDTEIEWIDAPENPDDRRLILRYRNNGTYVSGFSDSNYSQEDESRGWHGIPYSNILARYLKGQHFPIKHGGNAYVDPETQEPLPGVTTQEEAKERGIYTQNKRIQSQNETEMRETMQADFEEWADSADSEMRSRIAEAYNRTYRSRSFPDFDGTTLNLPGFNFPLPIFEHNLAAAEKMVFNQGGGDNHSVGAGKTFASIIAIETLRQRGLVNKPMFVVPSQVIEKWMKEYQELFPDARILVLRGKSEGLREELFRAQVYDYDSIFITQTGFKALELSPEARRERINERIEKNAQIAENLREDLESDFPTSMVSGIPDGIEERINEWADDIEKIQEEAAEEQVDRIFLDELGVDSFIFDEAHAYKNASAPSQLAADLGIVGDVSQRAVDTKTKVDWLFWKHGDDVNSFILTATPLENNPLEVWHMLQLCGPSVLEKYGIESLDAFIDLYVEVQRRIERKVDGSFDSEEVVTGFQNVTELQRVLDERLDIMSYDELINFYTDPEEEGGLGLDADEIPFGRPDAEVHHDVLEPSEIHEVLLEDIRLRADIIRQALSNGIKLTDNYLSLTTDGGAMAEDLRIYQPGFWGYDGPGLKIDTIAEEVADEYKRTGLPLDEKGDPIYPPLQTPGHIEIESPPEARQNPPTARENPRIVTDRFGAPIGRQPSPEDERENPAAPNLGRTAHRAARSNPTESEEAFIESLDEGDEVELDPDFAPGISDGETVEVDGFAPRNQIIFTSSASFKDGPFMSENPAEELPYVESVERYDTNDMEPPLYVRFESDSWLREIKRRIVEQGVPADKVAIVSGTIIGLEEGPDGEMRDRYVESDDDKNKFKAQVQEKFQRGEINIIIGTNAISEGMNLDRYTTALYHMDVPWKPSNVEQRNGRALRQGNIYGKMDITFKLLERSFDNYRLKLVNKKQSWIDDVLYGDFDLSEGDSDKVRTSDDTGSQSQSMDYQEMMVATSESDVIKRFFEAVHDVQQLDPKLDRLESERKTRRRKLKSAKEEIGEWGDQLEIQRREFNDVLTSDLPEEEEFEEDVHYEADLRYNRGKEWRGEIRMMVAGDRSFEFTGGAGLSGSNVGRNANVGTKLITARVTDGSPKVQIRYAWSKRSRRNRSEKARSSETYLQRNLNGVAADHEDWMDYWREDVEEVVEGEIREQVKDNLGEEESLDEENLPELPDPLTIEALWSLFSDRNDNRLDDLTYSEVKQMIGIEPGGRFGSEECWQRWTPVIERGIAEGLLSYAHTYESLASETISEIETKQEQARNQRDLMERTIGEIEEQISETEERLEEAKQQVDGLQGQVNDELSSRFDGRGGLYNYLNQIREEYGIETEIPMRVVGVDTGSDTEEDDEPDDDILVNADIDDVTEEGEEAFQIDEGEGGGEQDSPDSTPTPGSAEKPQDVSSGRLEGLLEKTDDSADGYSIVDDESDYIAWAESRPGMGVEVNPDVLFGEDREVPSFESPALSDRMRLVVADNDGGIYSHFGSGFAKRLPEPVPHILSEPNRLKAMVGQGLQGGYVDEMIAVADPVGEDAFEQWLFGYAQRQMALGNGGSVAEVRSRLKSEYGDFEPRGTPSQVMPSTVGLDYSPIGLVVPSGARLRAPEDLARNLPAFALLDAYVALAPKHGASSYEDVHYIYADHWQFVMQALTTGNTDTVTAGNVVMGVLPEGERQTTPPAVYFKTPSGVQAFIKMAASGDPSISAFDDDSATDMLTKSSLPQTFGARSNGGPEMRPVERQALEALSRIEETDPNLGQPQTQFTTSSIASSMFTEASVEPGSEQHERAASALESLENRRLVNKHVSDRPGENRWSLTDGGRSRVRENPAGGGDHRDPFPATPIGSARANPGQDPTDVASVDTDHALSYLARTEPGSFKVNAGEKQVRANEEEVHHIFTDPEGSLLLIVPDSRVETAEVPEGTAEEAEEMHEEFTHYDADSESMVMDLPDSDPDEAPVVGHADEIIYESDKVMRPGDEKGEIHTYVHEFDEGQRPVRQWGDVAVVDDVAVDGRGILN